MSGSSDPPPSRLEPNVAEHVTRIANLWFQTPKPAIGIAHLDPVQAVAGDAVKEPFAVIHQPDHEPPLRGHARIDHGMLHVDRLAGLGVGKWEADLGVLRGGGIDRAGPGGQLKAAARLRSGRAQ
jgi:hypothetical protein